MSYRFGKNLKLETTGGIVIARKANLQGQPFNEENYEIANARFFKFGIIFVASKKITDKHYLKLLAFVLTKQFGVSLLTYN